MRRLTTQELEYLSNEWLKTCECQPDEQDEFCKRLVAISCAIAFPLGELMNRKLVGTMWILRNFKSVPRPRPITDKYRFDAQGLEGCFELEHEDLAYALTLWREVAPNRINIFVEGKLKMSEFMANVISVTKVQSALKKLLATYESEKAENEKDNDAHGIEYWDGACQTIYDVATALKIPLKEEQDQQVLLEEREEKAR